jgi:two-component system phosphate regulon sensor histidine kinase PhoR
VEVGMKLSRMWKIYLIFTIVLLAAMVGFSLYLQGQMVNRLMIHLQRDALIIIRTLAHALPGTGEPGDLERFCKDYRDLTGLRITVVRSDGKVIGESNPDLIGLGNHRDRPEIQAALRERTGTSVRFSRSLGMDMLYAAVFLRERNCVVRLAMPMTEVKRIQNDIMLFMSLVLYLAPILAVVASFVLTRHLTRAPSR